MWPVRRQSDTVVLDGQAQTLRVAVVQRHASSGRARVAPDIGGGLLGDPVEHLPLQRAERAGLAQDLQARGDAAELADPHRLGQQQLQRLLVHRGARVVGQVGHARDLVLRAVGLVGDHLERLGNGPIDVALTVESAPQDGGVQPQRVQVVPDPVVQLQRQAAPLGLDRLALDLLKRALEPRVALAEGGCEISDFAICTSNNGANDR